jgi:peptide/nickel transport system substrate-binding protein
MTVLSMGCTGSSRKTAVDTLVIGLSTAPANLDPRFATDATSGRMDGLLFSSLVRVGSDLEITGDAAESWTYQNLIYTFQLRPGLKFSNGRAVESSDIDFSFKEFLKATNPFASSFRSISRVEVRYEAGPHGVRAVKLYMKDFVAPFLRDLTRIKILPQAEVLAAGQDFGLAPIGSGPFVLTSQNSGDLIFRRSELHPYLKPKIKWLDFKIVHDDNTRLLKIMKEEIDLEQQELPPQKVTLLEKDPRFLILRQPGLSVTYLALNLLDPVLKSKPIRAAIARAFDRDKYIHFKLGDFAERATSLLTPINPFFNSSLAPIPYDPSEAKRILATQREIEPAALAKEIILKTNNSPMSVENGRVLAFELTQIGLKVRLQSFEWGTFYNDVQKSNFQIATMRWTGTLDPDLYRIAFDSKELPPTGRNRGHYHNAALDPLLDAGLHFENRQQRIHHYLRIQSIVYDDLAIIPLWYDMEVAVINKRVKGFQLSRNADYTPFMDVTKDP